MRKKVLAVIGVIIVIAILTFCIMRILNIISFLYNNDVLICTKEDKKFIRKNSYVEKDYNIVYSNNNEYEEDYVKVIYRGWHLYPSIFGEQAEISDTGGEISTYIEENENYYLTLFVFSFPYFLIIIVVWRFFIKIIIPIINE